MTAEYAECPRVFLIEDDSAVRRALQFSLELDAFTVEAFESAEALSRRGDLSTAACLVIDYHLPDLNGLDLLQGLRADGVEVPAVLVTSQPNHAVRARAVSAGVEIVEKPLLSDALADAIRAGLASSRMKDLPGCPGLSRA